MGDDMGGIAGKGTSFQSLRPFPLIQATPHHSEGWRRLAVRTAGPANDDSLLEDLQSIST